MKIAADRDVCIGAGLCVGTSDAVFDQDDGGIVLVLVQRPEGIGPHEAQSIPRRPPAPRAHGRCRRRPGGGRTLPVRRAACPRMT